MTAGVWKSHGDSGGAATRREPQPLLRPQHPNAVFNDFLRAVKVPGTTFSTLQIFAEALEKNGEELVREVVQRTTGTEVASLLNDSHKLKSVDIALIFSVLEKIILTVASELEGKHEAEEFSKVHAQGSCQKLVYEWIIRSINQSINQST